MNYDVNWRPLNQGVIGTPMGGTCHSMHDTITETAARETTAWSDSSDYFLFRRYVVRDKAAVAPTGAFELHL